jgi:hypothetical protein
MNTQASKTFPTNENKLASSKNSTKLIRVGTDELMYSTVLNPNEAFDLIYNGFSVLVNISNYLPWQHVNGTWTGAFGHLIDDNQTDWKLN